MRALRPVCRGTRRAVLPLASLVVMEDLRPARPASHWAERVRGPDPLNPDRRGRRTVGFAGVGG